MACHAPKPILLSTGEITFPYAWQPKVVDIGMIRIGDFNILAVPGEFTTMSGRRLRERVDAVFEKAKVGGLSVVAGLSNTYSDYVTTREEYGAQRYEGASTIFGPNTLEAYIQNFETIAEMAAAGKKWDPSPADQPKPLNLLGKQWSFILPVFFDHAPVGVAFGENIRPPAQKYARGSKVSVEFQAGNPRNDLLLEGTYLSVERELTESRNWVRVYTDNDWETRFIWKRTNGLFGWSKVIIEWNIPKMEKEGTYRICHFGHTKSTFGRLEAYSGCTKSFLVG